MHLHRKQRSPTETAVEPDADGVPQEDAAALESGFPDGPEPAAGREPATGPELAAPGSGRRRFAWLGTAASLLIFAISVAVLWHVGTDVDLAEVSRAFTAASARQVGLAVLFTSLSYLLLTGYDALALRQLKLRVPYLTTALASFTSYAVSFNLGFPLLTAGTVRYWIYAPKGVSAGRVAGLTVVTGLTFWLGMGAVLFVLLPSGHGLGFETFLAIYVLAVMLGVASHAPGGLGVFEATILLALSSLSRESVLGALLLFRLCYYVAPFILALALLGAYEISNRLRAARGVLRPEDA